MEKQGNGDLERAEVPARLVKFDSIEDPANPLGWRRSKKYTIVGIISFGSTTTTCCSSMISPCFEGISKSFHVSHEVATLGLSLFVVGLGLGPLLLGPLSEFVGRRYVYICSFLIFTIFNIPVAVAKNIGTLLAFRFLSGLSSAAFLSVAGGTVADLFPPAEISLPMSIYTASPFVGPALGPILAGFIAFYSGSWRWVFHVQYIWAAVVCVLLLLFVPETYGPRILKNKAAKLRKETGDSSYQSALDQDQRSIMKVVTFSCYKPFELLLLEPMALLLNLWTALLLGILYAFFTAFPIVFQAKGFATQILGLSFLGILIGNILGPVLQTYFTKQYRKKAKELGRKPDPEEHLKRAAYGGIIAPLSLIGFAFTTYPHVHWVAPILFTIPFAISMFWIYSAVFTYLVDAFRPVAASAMASNSFLRSAFAASFPLFTTAMYHKMHPQWASFLCAMLLALLGAF